MACCSASFGSCGASACFLRSFVKLVGGLCLLPQVAPGVASSWWWLQLSAVGAAAAPALVWWQSPGAAEIFW